MKARIFLFSAMAIAVTACSSNPPANSALDMASNRFEAASGNARVSTLAADELKQADQALQVARKSWADKEKTSTVNHLAYLASQRVAIAEETAASRTSQAITAGAGAERDKSRLALRTKEVEQVNWKLAESRASNASTVEALARSDRKLQRSEQGSAEKSTELAAADAIAQHNRAEMNRNDARVNDLESQLKELNAKQTERGLVVTLGDMLFNTGQARILPGSSGNLAKLAEFFKSNPNSAATIEGHTDSVGAAAANIALSQRRANAVMTTLTNLGVSADRLSIHAHGADSPIASNETAAGRQMNRRVEIVFAQTP